MTFNENDFLPTSREDCVARGWYWYDFLIVTGDAYVDHPSFGAAVIARTLENAGFRVAILARPRWRDIRDFSAMTKPRRAVMVTSGNIDSMVEKYTAAKKPRTDDVYGAPGGNSKPDRAILIYSKLAREAFGNTPIVLGGLEASLRRFAHYDYWDDNVRPSYLADAGADCILYGMAERSVLEYAKTLSPQGIRGAIYRSDAYSGDFASVYCPSFEEVASSKRAYAEAFMTQYRNTDYVTAKTVVQPHGNSLIIANPPSFPLETDELDKFAALKYTREAHPGYTAPVKSLEEVKFSIIHNRGCFGGCHFCAITFHQGRTVTARSHGSVVAEALKLTEYDDFKGYIGDVGGPTANWRGRSCAKQKTCGMCKRSCLTPEPCSAAELDGSDYLELLRKLRSLPKIKKVFVRSGLRFDALLEDKSGLFEELVAHHISGQLKTAPEHCVAQVLTAMNKPGFDKYLEFAERFKKFNIKHGKNQYIVPYLISSHPGCTLDDAVTLAVTLRKTRVNPEQVQDFYPTPGTLSTCMYHTGLDPLTMKEIYVPKSPREKAEQRALLQCRDPKNRQLVISALKKTGRMNLYPLLLGKKKTNER